MDAERTRESAAAESKKRVRDDGEGEADAPAAKKVDAKTDGEATAASEVPAAPERVEKPETTAGKS